MPQNSRLGVVCFGKDYQLNTQLGGSFVAVGTLIPGVDDGAITVFTIDYISIAAGILNKGLIFHAITF